MQKNISDDIKEQTLGLKYDALFKKMTEFRKRILGGFEQLEPKFDTNSNAAKVKIGSVEYTFVSFVESKSLDDYSDSLEKTISEKLSEFLNNDIFENETTKYIFSKLIDFTLESEIVSNVQVSNIKDDELSKKLSNLFARILVSKMKIIIIEKFRTVDGSFDPSKPLNNYTNPEIKTKLADFVIVFNSQVTNVRSSISKNMDKVESTLSNVFEKASNFLVSSNIGLGFSQGTGDFTGGFNLGFKFNPTKDFNCQLGVYINGNFNNGDSTTISGGLWGGQFRIAYDNLQLDLLGSTYFKNDQIRKSYEMGLSISYLLNESIIIGASYFYLDSDIQDSTSVTITKKYFNSLGIYLKPTANNSPVLYLGASKPKQDDTKWKFGFQILYPIN